MTYLPPELLVVQFLKSITDPDLSLMVDNTQSYGALIFRDALPLKLSPSGLRAITIAAKPGGTSPTLFQVYASMITCSIYCDHTRDINGNASVEDGIDRAWAVFGTLDFYMNSSEPIVVNSTTAQAGRMTTPLESWDQDQNLPYLTANYDVSIVSGR